MILLNNIIWVFEELFLLIQPVLNGWFEDIGYTFEPLYFVVIAVVYCFILVSIPICAIKFIRWLFDL